MKNKLISVKYAMLIGNIIVVLPFFLILGLTSIPTIITISKYESYWLIPIAIILSIIISLTCLIILSIKWRIWAFTNVDDRHGLRNISAKQRFISSKGKLLSKLDFINSKKSKDKLKVLEEWFISNKPIIIDDDLIPDETSIDYIKPSIYQDFSFVFYILGFIGLTLLIKITIITLIICVIIFFLGLYLFIKERKKRNFHSKNNPVLILNNYGINSNLYGFISWDKIDNIEINLVGNKKELVIQFLNENVKRKRLLSFLLNELSINELKLNHIILIYQGRFSNNKYLSQSK